MGIRYMNPHQRKLKGIIFDFNGVLVFDSNLHEKAWAWCMNNICSKEFSDDEILESIHGQTNAQIIRKFVDPNISEQEVSDISNQKEVYYRSLCEKSANFSLSPGAEQLLDLIVTKQIPCTIATSAGEDNINFYFDKLDLGKWFTKERIVFNDGSLPSKPHPKIFSVAIEKIGLEADQCVIVEDSLSGLHSAFQAGAGFLCAIGKTNIFSELPISKNIDLHITSLTQFPFKSLFTN